MSQETKTWKTLLLALVLFLLMEFLLQLRAQLKFGNSILTSALASNATPVAIFQQHDGYQLLTPDIEVKGSTITIQSNNHGLRSAAIGQKADHVTRVIALGASSTYGAYAITNDATFPAILQRTSQNVPLEVINAGIPGNDISSQHRLYAEHLTGLSEDVLLLYSGLSNDVGGLCRQTTTKKSYALPQIQPPKWLLTVDLLLKNSTELRYVPYKFVSMPDLTPYLQRYADKLTGTITVARQRGVKAVLLAENLRAFRPEQSEALQQQLAASALYYTPCLSVQQFASVFEQYNLVQQQIASQFAFVHYIPLSAQVPGGKEYFTDSVHFSAKGEQLMARALAQSIQTILQEAP